MTKLKFSILLALLLAFPAALLVFGHTNIDKGHINFEYFIPNYFYTATPHLLVAILVFWPRCRQPVLLFVLLLLNMLLVLFKLWIKFNVIQRESSLAWILYIPLWSIALVFIGLILWLAKRHRIKTSVQ